MKIKHSVIVTLIIVLISTSIGLYFKRGYTDFVGLEEFSVAAMNGELFESSMENIIPRLDDNNIIVAVRCEERFEFRSGCTSQKATIVKVFKGDSVKEGDIIDIIRGNSTLGIKEDERIGGVPIINMGFVNEMSIGKEYLVFLDRKIDTYNEENVYIQSDEFIITPTFCYENIDNTIDNPLTSGVTYTRYDRVKTCEFFVVHDNLNEKVEEYKKEIFEKYPL